MTQVCPHCSGDNDTSGTYCPPCTRTYNKEYWARTKDLRNARKKINVAITKERNFLFVLEYLKANPCMDCGIDDPVVLEFDHRDPSTKRYNVSEMIPRGSSISSIKAEIDKCDVVCANCHRRRTVKMFDHRRGRV